MLDFIDRHKAGIMGTIVIHLMLVTGGLIMKINSLKEHESAVVLNLLNEEEVKQLIDPTENQEKQSVPNKELFTQEEKEYLGAKNIGTNEADKDASKDIDKMVSEIKGELNIKDRPAPDTKPAPQTSASEDALPDKSAKEEKVDVTKFTGVRTFYKGPTTVSYYLEGRYHQNLPIPVYKCQGHGKVVMKIEVNQQGYVVSLEVNKAESEIPEDCILETAEKAARTTRFNSITTGPEKQQGKLTYIFIAQ